MTKHPDLSTAFADMLSEADTLDRNNAAFSTSRVREYLELLKNAAEPWTKFINETDAILRAGRKLDWIRAKFATLEREGHAYTEHGVRFYRECMIPRRAKLDEAARAGRDAAARAAQERRVDTKASSTRKTG